MKLDAKQAPSQQTLDDVRRESRAFLKQRLFFWGIRWVLGFLMIAGIVHFYPATSWLWLAGAGVAIISLGAIVTSSYFLERQFKKTERTLNLAGGEGLAVSSSLKHDQLDCRSFDDGADGGDGANGSD